MRKNRGITLISLVVTVLVILILTSISVYSGIGTIRYTKFNKAKNEMEYIQSTVNLWNEKYRTLKTSQEKKEYIDTIGEPTEGENSTCDATALTKTVQATGIIAGKNL